MIMTPAEVSLVTSTTNIGNNDLYCLCKTYPLSSLNNDALASQIWLIGRSYAASPERRHYNGLKPAPNLFKGNGGTSNFFDELANELIKNAKYKSLILSVGTLNVGGGYLLNNSPADISKLTESIKLVLDFNDYLKDALCELDLKVNIKTCKPVLYNNIKNFISFSSKFMHFHCPDLVFIKDSITTSNFVVRNSSTGTLNLIKKDVDTLNSSIKSSFKIGRSLIDQEEEYMLHCCSEYLLAAKIKYELDCIGKKVTTYYPRVVDTYMLNYRVQIK